MPIQFVKLDIPVFHAAAKPPDKSALSKKYFYFSTKTYVVGTQKNRLNETVLLSTHNLCLNRCIRK